ncbi:MAG: FAD-dependent oxidoreductase [Armatimonadota bacterium]|nr:FAD-dependent oxidoreductase [Armatimonadota bacterium]MDR5703234.1 FAD-dependent oxidoreductase [Armatimonadota bacterium]
MRTADVLIVGGGVIGCSIAYHLLRRDRSLRVVLLEKEEMVGMGSTARATGGIRHQFSSAANIRLTQLSLPFYMQFEEETGYSVHFRPHGYLFLTTHAQVLEEFRRNVDLQNSLGVPSRIVTPAEAAKLVPGLRAEDLVGGSFCDRDGTAEPAAAVQGFATRAQSWGLEILTQQQVVALLREGDRIVGARTQKDTFQAPVVVIAAGAHSSQITATAGLEIPVRSYRRQVSVVAPIPELDVEIPLTVDMDTGFYIHRMGHSGLLLGGTDKDSRPGFSLDVDWEGLDRLLAAGCWRIPLLEKAKVVRTYVGLRALTPDHHPILGRVEALEGLVLACGDSGHGFMHAPAIGLLVSEEILDGRAKTMDLSPFRLERFGLGVQEEAQVF